MCEVRLGSRVYMVNTKALYKLLVALSIPMLLLRATYPTMDLPLRVEFMATYDASISITQDIVHEVEAVHDTQLIIDRSSIDRNTQDTAILQYSDEELDLMARVIQSEAIGEPYDGKVAVGAVIVNRSMQREQTISQVVYAKGQFSGVNKRNRLFNSPPNEDCISAAMDALSGIDPTDGATYFLNEKVVVKTYGRLPSWVKKLTFIKKIGSHSFYK